MSRLAALVLFAGVRLAPREGGATLHERTLANGLRAIVKEERRGCYGLPERWLADFPEQVGRVSLADVRAVFARHVRPERFVTVVGGATEGH
ncbi:MAG TPA: hypothetical protein VKC64_01585 [Burkholderiales bacterium]|nr:hypothetical protein [Burkholderiales bacterium]